MTGPRTERGEHAWRLLGIINPYGLLVAYRKAHPDEPPQPTIMYIAADRGRGGRTAYYRVIVPGTRTDDSPSPHWRNYGDKTFDVWSRFDRDRAFAAAVAWAGERYGVTEWARVPHLRVGGAHAPKRVVDWLNAELRQARRSEASTRTETGDAGQS